MISSLFPTNCGDEDEGDDNDEAAATLFSFSLFHETGYLIGY